MREILFRGRAKSNEWVFGSYVEAEKLDGSGLIEHFIIEKEANGREYPVNPQTVSEFSGLSDSNGKKIFEGDIVVISNSINGAMDEDIGYVEVKFGAFGLHRKFRTTYATIDAYYHPFKDWLEKYSYMVIGNIWENPELLEE